MPIQGGVFPLKVEASLIYQTASPRFIKDLLRTATVIGQEFGARYEQVEQAPFRVAQTTLLVDPR